MEELTNGYGKARKKAKLVELNLSENRLQPKHSTLEQNIQNSERAF